MSSTFTKFCSKYVMSYIDSSNNTHEIAFNAFDAFDAYDCINLAKEFNSYVNDHQGSEIRIQQKFWGN